MCTAISYKTKDSQHFLGRNLDVTKPYGQQVMVVPRNFNLFSATEQKTLISKFACVGMGIVVGNHPFLFDGVNEKGLAAAGLNFTRYAQFANDCDETFEKVSASDFIYWALSQFETINTLKKALKKTCIMNKRAKPGLEVPKLHWMFTDLSGKSIVIECTSAGMQVYDNPVGVLSNDPDFNWHMTNLQHYITLHAKSPEPVMYAGVELKPFGHGTGRFGIPGDGTPSSRFITAAFYKQTIHSKIGEMEGMNTVFKVLDRVAICHGSEIGPNGEMNHTLYQSVMCQESGTYYYSTYDNRRINGITLTPTVTNAKTITLYPYKDTQEINFQFESQKVKLEVDPSLKQKESPEV